MMLNGFTETLKNPERNNGTARADSDINVVNEVLFLALLKHVNSMVAIPTAIMSED